MANFCPSSAFVTLRSHPCAGSMDPKQYGCVLLTRGVSPGFAAAQRMEDDGGAPLSDELAAAEHDAFVQKLKPHASRVITIPPDDAQPDCVFVEDCVVALPARGFFACCPHPSRRGEVHPVVGAAMGVSWPDVGPMKLRGLANEKQDELIEGGDVLYVKGGADTLHHYLVGVGNRSNALGAQALREALRSCATADGALHELVDEDMLFVVHEVDMNETGWLHLKSAITWAPNVGFVASSSECPVLRRALECLDGFEATPVNKIRDPPVIVPRHAANVLALPKVNPSPNGPVVFAHPDAVDAVKARGGDAVTVIGAEQPELARADGALTCCAVVLDPKFAWGRPRDPNYDQD